MSEGLATTFRVLAETDNEAAVRVLITALDSPYPSIQEAALKAILARRSPAGGRELLARLHTMPESWITAIRQQSGRMTGPLRDALLSGKGQLCINASRAAIWFREYELIPTLLAVLEDRAQENTDLAAETLTRLVAQLYEDLAGSGKDTRRRDPRLVLSHVLGSLESSVQRFSQHKRREVIDAFLLLVGRDNVTLMQILQDPHHPTFLPMVDTLSRNTSGGVVRLLLGCLDDAHPPSTVLSVISKRTDLKFVQHLLHKVGRRPSDVAIQNLKRIKSIGWLQRGGEFLDRLDEAAQHGAVRLVMTVNVSRLDAFAVVEHLLLRGKIAARRQAAVALSEFPGVDANALAVRALNDPDPQVQANAAAQLRQRGIPGVLPRLVQMVDSPHAVVRKAARESLNEFTFSRFVSAFDMLDDEVRQSTGRLVKKIDLQTVPLLQQEMESPLRTRRLRGLAIARTLDLMEELEEEITELLYDEDHLVRGEAAASLGEIGTPTSRLALQRALGDSSVAVQEAARRSLEHQTRSIPART
ncbi:MAG TPA: HEAT repeat domain-containing protein [Thermoguttaceae bacterium]|nr:HEAT repeat domain-containing protein [Thermoguttaceae bacterium]